MVLRIKRKTFVYIMLISVVLIVGMFVFNKKSIQDINKDVNIIQGAPSDDMAKFTAIIRLGHSKNPKYISVVINEFENMNINNKIAATEMLKSFHDDKSFDFLVSILKNNTHSEIRISALKALSQRKNKRVKVLLFNEFKNDSSYSEIERAYLYLSIIKLFKNHKNEFLAISKIVSLFKSEKVETRSKLTEIISKNRIFNKDIRMMVEKAALNGKLTSTGNIFAFKYLSLQSKEWFSLNVMEMINSKDVAKKIALLQTIHISCPENIWEVLEVAMGQIELYDYVLKALLLLNYNESLIFLNKINPLIQSNVYTQTKLFLDEKKTKSNCY